VGSVVSTTDSVLDLFRITGRVAVVTEAGSGLGAGFARALAEAGADIVIAGRRLGHLEATARSVRAVGRECLAVPTDVTRPADCAALVEAAVDQLGRQLHHRLHHRRRRPHLGSLTTMAAPALRRRHKRRQHKGFQHFTGAGIVGPGDIASPDHDELHQRQPLADVQNI
jgi:hypothetical protein